MTAEEVKARYQSDPELLYAIHGEALKAIDNLRAYNDAALKAINELEERLLLVGEHKQVAERSKRHVN